MKASNIIIFGHKGHGKDTACQYLKETFKLTAISSSWFACQKFLYEDLKKKYGYESIEQCYADRINKRQEWYEAIRDYNTPDKTLLGRDIFSNYNIYNGIRDNEEYYALREAGMISLAIWVDASDRLEEESINSMKLCKEDADIIISNNLSEEILFERLYQLFFKLI